MKLTALFAITTLSLTAVLGVTSCKKKGPAEKLGEDIDRVIEDVKEASEPKKGPAEKLGEKIDDATRR